MFIIFYSCFVVFVLSAPVTFVVYRTTLLDRHVSVSQQLFDLFRLYVLFWEVDKVVPSASTFEF